MDKAPYFNCYPVDFLADSNVVVMTTEEVGAYWLLLCHAWSQTPAGTIPDDDATLASWSRLTARRWSKVRPAILKVFVPGDDGRLHQKRMKKEYAEFADKRSKRSEAGKKGAEKTWQCHTFANGKESPNENGNAITRASDSDSNSDSESSILDGGPGETPTEIGLIVREWLHYVRGQSPRLHDHKTLGEFFGELLRRKISADAIKEKIREASRDRTQTHWQFAKQFFPAPGDRAGKRSKPGDPGYYDGINEFLKGGSGDDTK